MAAAAMPIPPVRRKLRRNGLNVFINESFWNAVSGAMRAPLVKLSNQSLGLPVEARHNRDQSPLRAKSYAHPRRPEKLTF
jgi:hypothetical protein